VKQRISTLVTSGVLALALVGVAVAGPFDDAVAAYQRGDYAFSHQQSAGLQTHALARLKLAAVERRAGAILFPRAKDPQAIEIQALKIGNDRQNGGIERQRSARRWRHRTLRRLPGVGARAGHSDLRRLRRLLLGPAAVHGVALP
jgi:hypothetical protein